MCLLIFIPAGKIPLYENVRNASYTNGDGFGWAIENAARDGFHVGKSMDFEAAWSAFESCRSLNPDGNALFHLRWATHGSTSLDNVHPFYIGREDESDGVTGVSTLDSRVIMAHNGILPLSPKDDRSDTKLFAEDYMPYFVYDLDDDKVWADIEEWARGSKLVFLVTGDINLQYGAYIANEKDGHFHKEDGCWYSNTSYVYSPPSPWRGWKSNGSGRTSPWSSPAWDTEDWDDGWEYKWDAITNTWSRTPYKRVTPVDDGPDYSTMAMSWEEYLEWKYGEEWPTSCTPDEANSAFAERFADGENEAEEAIRCFHCGTSTTVNHADPQEKYRCDNAMCFSCLLCGEAGPCNCAATMNASGPYAEGVQSLGDETMDNPYRPEGWDAF